MWRRHRWWLAYGLAAGSLLVAVAAASGFDSWFERIGLGLAGAAVAVAATTDYRVLARTDRGLVLLRASRVRQVATALDRRLGDDAVVDRIGGTLLANDWRVDGQHFTVAKSSEASMSALAAGPK